MSLLGKLVKTGFDIATSPIEVVKDVATMGGLLTDEDEPYTFSRVRRLMEDAEEVREEIDEL